MKWLLVLAVLAGTVLHVQPAEAAVTTYRVVGTGDSIFTDALPYLNGTGRQFYTERGRDAYTLGQQGLFSTASIWRVLVARSQPGGWIVIQDNGARTTETEWRELWRRIVSELPTDRCLVAVLPWYSPAYPDNPNTGHQDSVNKRNIMVAELRHAGCVRFLAWDALNVNSTKPLTYDAQHPNDLGARRLGNALTAIVGA